MIGKIISHYKIVAKVGGGGMGVVYKAHDEKLDRTVALKFLPEHMSHADPRRQRFVREARAASALDHPNICTIYDIDETGDGQTFIAMAFCDGEPLNDVIAGGALPFDLAMKIAIQVAHGLASAHARGIVHRDIKPANIIVSGGGDVKIVDFGLAKLAGQTAITLEGTTLGTIAYMAPEQAQGGEVDHRADIWSLGAVIYEMVTGARPFAADHQAAVIYRILNDDPAPVGSLRGDTPEALTTVINRALAKNPADRFASMDELVSALECAWGHTAKTATEGPSSVLACARAALKRHDWPEALRGFIDADSQTDLEPEDLDRLVAAALWMNRMDICIDAGERAHARYVKTGRPVDAARAAIELADNNYIIGARSVCTGWIKRAEKLLETEPDAVENGYLARLKAKIAIQADQDLDAAAHYVARAMEVAEKHRDADLRALATQDRGRVLVLQNRVREGMELLDEAMATAISGELSPVVVGTTFCNMISTCDKVADYRRAGEWSDRAMRWCQPHSESAFPGICGVRRAEVMRVRGDWSGAQDEAERASERSEGVVTVAAEAHYVVGEIKLRRGEYSEAEASFQEAHRLGRHPVPGLALLRVAQGRLDAARSLIDRALSGNLLELDRIRLLPAGVEIALAVGDVVTARERANELVSLAARFESAVFSGYANHAAGSVALAEGNVETALASLGTARLTWQTVDMPYEHARTCLLMAAAYWKVGETDIAGLEARAARGTFERLGAAADLELAKSMLEENS